MKLQIHSVRFDADQKLLDFIQRRVDKLETFYDHILEGEVYLEVSKDTDHRENKVVGIKLFIPGNSLFAKEHAHSFEEATDLTVEALRRQIKKRKEKQSVNR